MEDKRVTLKSNTKITGAAHKTITIVSEIGRGANCIVYNASYSDNIGVEHHIRLKECYPYYLSISRKNDNTLFAEDEKKFEEAKNEFINAYKKNIEIKQTFGLVNSTINSEEIIIKNNTIYILMALDEVIDYGKYRDKALKEVFICIKSVAKIVQRYHNKGLLHLDIKPENIFIMPETKEHVLLFDFDTVISKPELKKAYEYRMMYSNGFSAPEQVKGEIAKIDYHTDIYSIGATIFYKLFGRVPKLSDIKMSGRYDFDDMIFKSDKYQPKLFRELGALLKNTLAIAADSRCNDISYVIEKLDELIVLADIEDIKPIDTFQYNSAYFVGRQKEIKTLDNELENRNVVFLSGIGGIGKTEIAKQYANIYRKKYNVIIFAVFEKDIITLVNEEICINKAERDEKETDEEYFRRKIKLLKQTAKDDDLIIIDNFDVEYDINLELLLECKCKFIITTRMDYRDFNYSQINIGRMKDENDILELFYTYNDIEYSEDDEKYINKIIEFVEEHTMTVELIAKYLRTTLEKPENLYSKFLEKEGIANTEETEIKQRKDRKLKLASVNAHIGILFDISGFNNDEKKIMSSLSLFAGIRILRSEYEKIYGTDTVDLYLNKLIKKGWIEYNEKSKKISLHQVIQDIVYKNLAYDAEKCPDIVKGMIRYSKEKPANHSEKVIRRKLFKIFMERISGENISYAKLCLAYGKEPQLDKALEICKKNEDKETYDIIQKIYRRKIDNVLINGVADSIDKEKVLNRLKQIKDMLDQIIYYCKKYSKTLLSQDDFVSYKKDDRYAKDCETIRCNANKYIAKEYITAASEMQKGLEQNMYFFLIDESEKDYARINELDTIYGTIELMYKEADKVIPQTDYDISQKEKLYKKIFDFYSEGDFMDVYRNKYYADMDKAYKYQEILKELRQKESVDTSDMSITDENGTTRFWFDDISCAEYARKLEEEGKYDEAEKYYKKSYENGEEMYETAINNIAGIYEKTGKYNKAAQAYESVLDKDRRRLETLSEEECLIGYSCDICLKLIKLYIRIDEYAKAEKYIEEMISYEKKDAEEHDEYAACYVIAAYYIWYRLEKTIDNDNNIREDIDNNAGSKQKVKEQFVMDTEVAYINETRLWKECIRYYEMLGNNRIEPEIFDFIYEYVMKEDIAYKKLIKIIDSIENRQNEGFKEKLINAIVKKYEPDKLFVKYHIILFVKLSEALIEYEDNDVITKKALNYLNNAKNLYEQNKTDDEYIFSILCMTEIKIRTAMDIDVESSEYDENYAIINELWKKCNYMAVAKYHLTHKKNGLEKQLQIWQEAADGYEMAEKYSCVEKCLEQIYKIMNEMCEKKLMKKTDLKYMNLLEKIIKTHIKQTEKTTGYLNKQKTDIAVDSQITEDKLSDKNAGINENYKKYADEYLKIAIKSYDVEEETKAWKKIYDIKRAGDLFEEIEQNKMALEIYIKATYMYLKEQNVTKSSKIKGEVADLLIMMKDKLTECITTSRIDKTSDVPNIKKNESGKYDDKGKLENECQELIKKIGQEYEYKKIEFKH